MGGWAPFGYDVKDRKLIINEAEAKLVRPIFKRFARGKSGTKLAQELAKENVRNKYGKLVDKGYLYKLLNNRVYLGDAVHKGTAYPGEHKAIIDQETWDSVREVLKESPRKRAGQSRARTPALLKGMIFGPTGLAMTPTHTRKNGRLYRYYISTSLIKSGAGSCSVGRIPAAAIEEAVIDQIRRLVQSPEIIVSTWRAAKQNLPKLSERQVRTAMLNFDGIWGQLFPAEQTRVIQLLVKRVDIIEGGANVTLNVGGLSGLFKELQPALSREAA